LEKEDNLDKLGRKLPAKKTNLYDEGTDEKRLRHMEERHQTILDSIEEGYVEVNLNGDAVFCNESYCRIIGYSMTELVGLNYREYMNEEVAKTVFEAYNKVFKEGISNKGFCYEVIANNGDKRIIENSISLIRDSSDLPVGFRSIVRDITDRKLAEKELERHRSYLQAVFESVKDGIITFNSNMEVINANKAAETICGLTAKKNCGRRLPDCLTTCDKNCFDLAINNIFSSKTTTAEYQIKCKQYQNPEQRVTITGAPLTSPDGQRMGTVVVIRDITRLSDLEKKLRERSQFKKIISKSASMQGVYELLDSLVDLDTTVLVTGESGTGKSLIANILHFNGNRALKPMVTVNCAALPENLLESELFGHVKGSFTGAVKDAQGRFQAASGGTIMLDEIGDISPRIQLKLLRVLEDKEFERVGDVVPIKADVRIIACTNRNLMEKVRLGEFREDLYYRLKVVEVKMPPLRERTEDIPLLVKYFLNIFNENFSKSILGVSNDVMEIFINYPWPGNIRELRHSIEHAFVLCRQEIISPDHLPVEVRGFCQQTSKIRPVNEKDIIVKALDKTYWNKAQAARLLMIDRSTVYRKIRKYQLEKSK
jgi:PAS domain S-box-containing protein